MRKGWLKVVRNMRVADAVLGVLCRARASRDTLAKSAFSAGIRACLSTPLRRRSPRRWPPRSRALSHGTAIIKPLTLLYRVINLNITTHVSRSFGPADLSQRGFDDVTERPRGSSPAGRNVHLERRDAPRRRQPGSPSDKENYSALLCVIFPSNRDSSRFY